MTTTTSETARGVTATAASLGYQGRGTWTGPSEDTVRKACQRGDLPAYQSGRKGTWRIMPSDARRWWNQR